MNIQKNSTKTETQELSDGFADEVRKSAYSNKWERVHETDETITFAKEEKAFGITYIKNQERLIAHVGLHVIMEENQKYDELFKKANDLPFSHEMFAAIMSVYDIKQQNENNQNK